MAGKGDFKLSATLKGHEEDVSDHVHRLHFTSEALTPSYSGSPGVFPYQRMV